MSLNLPNYMKKILLTILTLAVFAGCSLLSPYSITFTTPDGKVINPETDTLDLVISQPALAYISGIVCDDNLPIELLPILNDSMQVAQAHNLSLDLLTDQERGAECTITVTAFDNTTTSNSHNKITLYVLERIEIIEEEVVVEEEELVEEESLEEVTTEEEIIDEEIIDEETITTDEPTTTSEDSSGEESST